MVAWLVSGPGIITTLSIILSIVCPPVFESTEQYLQHRVRMSAIKFDTLLMHSCTVTSVEPEEQSFIVSANRLPPPLQAFVHSLVP